MDEYEEKILEYIDWVKPGLARQLGWRIPLIDRDSDSDWFVSDWFIFWPEEENARVLNYINKKLRDDMLETAARYKIWKDKGVMVENLEDYKIRLQVDKELSPEREKKYQELLKTMQEIDFKLAYSYEDILVHSRLMEKDLFEFQFSSIIEDVALWLLTQDIGTTVFFIYDDEGDFIYKNVTETGLNLEELSGNTFGYEKVYGYIFLEVENGLPRNVIGEWPKDKMLAYGVSTSDFYEWYWKQNEMKRLTGERYPHFYKIVPYSVGFQYTIDDFRKMIKREKIFLDYHTHPRKFIEETSIYTPRYKHIIRYNELLRKGFEEYLQKQNK